MKRNYLNFYGNLMKASDAYLVKILDTLATSGLLENTLVIATADHGEMGTAHGGMRQKNFNFYEESIRVPLVYSNPRLFPKAEKNHVAGLARRLPADARQPRRAPRPMPATTGQGVDYSDQILEPRAEGPAAGLHGVHLRRLPVRPGERPRIRSRRTTSPASASSATSSPATTTSDGNVPDQWEMYDLKTDPLERTNLAYKGYKRTPEQERQYRRLRRKLARVEQTRLQPLS